MSTQLLSPLSWATTTKSIPPGLSLSKLQSGIWEKQNSREEVFDITEMDESILQGLIEKDISLEGESFTL